MKKKLLTFFLINELSHLYLYVVIIISKTAIFLYRIKMDEGSQIKGMLVDEVSKVRTIFFAFRVLKSFLSLLEICSNFI